MGVSDELSRGVAMESELRSESLVLLPLFELFPVIFLRCDRFDSSDPDWKETDEGLDLFGVTGRGCGEALDFRCFTPNFLDALKRSAFVGVLSASEPLPVSESRPDFARGFASAMPLAIA